MFFMLVKTLANSFSFFFFFFFLEISTNFVNCSGSYQKWAIGWFSLYFCKQMNIDLIIKKNTLLNNLMIKY